MKKQGIIIGLLAVNFLVLLTPLAAIDARVVNVTGKVEVQAPGGAWVPAAAGQVISLRSTVSTGFNSRAVLSIGDSQVVLQPLTRIRVDELSESAGQARTALSLQAGAARSQVRNSGGSIRFSVATPVATAAVRGTDFTLSWAYLEVAEGLVEFSTDGQRVFVAAGGSSGLDVYGDPEDSWGTISSTWRVSPIPGGFPGDPEGTPDRKIGYAVITLE